MLVLQKLLLVNCIIFIFFFKQKTAYEITVRDWSSDVCSSDLKADQTAVARPLVHHQRHLGVAKQLWRMESGEPGNRQRESRRHREGRRVVGRRRGRRG